jgi:hypothetical protein
MRLSLTDKFLWDMFNVFQETSDIAVSLLIPSLAKYHMHIGNPVFDKYRHNKNKAKFSKLVYYAKRNNYIRVENLKGKQAIMLTKEGLGKALKASFTIEGKKKRKDGKWIMLTFDMPANNRRARDLLRSVLRNLGYKLFQQSVWVTPYDVSEKTERLLQFYSLEKYVKIFLIEEM